MTPPPVTGWPGGRELAERYTALRHPALVPVEVGDLPGAGAFEVHRRSGESDGVAGVPGTLTVSAALRAVGEVALGLQALHDLGLAHGDIRAGNLRSHADRWLLDGVARPGSSATLEADVAALGRLLDELLAAPDRTDPRVAAVCEATAAPGTAAAEVGRTALALASGAKPPRTAAQPARAEDVDHLESTDAAGPARLINPRAEDEFDTRRRRTRNRMLLVAAIVVIAGAGLLKLLDAQGVVRVPDEIGRTQPAASTDLRRAGLVPAVTRTAVPTAPNGAVVGQSPAPGQRVRPGRTVILRVAVTPSGSSVR